ncbi:ABC-type Fe3+ transport system substrate-binding protein [Anaerobacterium chartisolvens]|uniref:ABC-type Fe3+ transport system substrate-binding protein n=1 Tax=Anaerobacterium chartisolvens TaxID=1297424 RepID=A0A369BHN3_9FIRM|nr:ABC transporter substrate-binding protein [Anaerobacterium chartisolvens]RCX21070.1 ABC-type Fe3+ transport system substrate-binding protein [Anaerobacterium chartisolvens]
MKINSETKIGEILAQYPETLEVFNVNGFAADSPKALIEFLGGDWRLSSVLKARRLNMELFIQMLEEKIAGNEGVFDSCAEEGRIRRLDFLGYTVCPLKHTFRECFDAVLDKYRRETGRGFDCYVPSGCGGDDAYEEIWKSQSIDDLPGAIASIGFGDFFRKEFVDRFIDKGCFKAPERKEINADFAGMGLEDPDGCYTIYSVFPYIIMVDKKKLGNLPMPCKWDDLLKPVYRNNIIIGGSADDISEVLLLYLYKKHGDKGVELLARNVRDAWHAAKMAKVAGTSSTEGAAVYVMPWFFARSCPRTDVVSIVWPEDGALISPFYLLVKEDRGADLQIITDFVMGEELGQKSANSFFPVLNSEADNRLPENAAFQWLGWDYIKSNSMDTLKEHVKKIFAEHWVGG